MEVNRPETVWLAASYWYCSKYQKIVWRDLKTVKLNCLTLGEW